MKVLLLSALLVACAAALPHEPVQTDTMGCYLCKVIVEAAKTFADKEEPEVEAALDEVCDKLGEFAGACKEAVKEIVPLVYQYLDSDLNPSELCAMIGLCPSTSNFKTQSQNLASGGCFLCKVIVEAAKEFADKEEPEVEKIMDGVCDKLGEYADACKAAVKEIIPLVYKYLDSELSPEMICRQIGLCTSAASLKTQPQNLASTGCFLCKIIVEAAKEFADKEEPEVEKLMDEVCDKLGEYADACKAAVKEIIPLVYKYLDSELSPEMICRQIGLCTSAFAQKEQSLASGGCFLCKVIVEAAKEFADKEEPEVEKLMDEVCDKLGEYADACKAAVKEIIPLVYKYLDSELSPEMICRQIGLCTSLSLKARPQNLASTGCFLCKIIVEAAKEFADKEEPEVEKLMDEVCDKLGEYADACKAAVKEIIPLVYKYLDSELSPDMICRQIGLCASKLRRVPNYRRPKPLRFNDISCDICTALIQVAKQYADKKEPEVKQELDAECDKLGYLAGFCKDLVNEYVNEIYNYINDNPDMSDKQICAKMGLC